MFVYLSNASTFQVIHTSAGLCGINFNAGHADFWPNGGSKQPGCNVDVGGACAHGRSYLYYAESVKSNKFVGKKCADYKSYTGGKCNSAAAAHMGMYQLDRG